MTPDDGWIVDEEREAARQRGALFISVGPASGPFWACRFTDGPWMKRMQSTFHCVQCGTSMPAGPDYWIYCDHNQPPQPSAREIARQRVDDARNKLAAAEAALAALCV